MQPRSRTQILHNLDVGDIFHAQVSPNGASLICLTLTVTATSIRARTVTNQQTFEFDRATGVEIGGRGQPCTIDSVAPLPIEIHNVLLGMDRKYRLNLDPDRTRLTEQEKQALYFVADHYPANPL